MVADISAEKEGFRTVFIGARARKESGKKREERTDARRKSTNQGWNRVLPPSLRGFLHDDIIEDRT